MSFFEPSIVSSSLGFPDIFRPFVGFREVRLVNKESRHVSFSISIKGTILIDFSVHILMDTGMDMNMRSLDPTLYFLHN